MDAYDPDPTQTPEDDLASPEVEPLDPAAGFPSIRIPHRLEYLRRRPRRQPRWSPHRDGGHRRRRRRARSIEEGWRPIRIRAAPDVGAVRINFTYRNWGTTSAAFGIKPGRTQYCEGPYEAAHFQKLETDADVVDYQFQPVTIEWETNSGDRRSYTCDGIYETATGLTAFEDKANWDYFNDPQTADTLEQAKIEFARHGVDFERAEGTQLLDPVKSAIIKEVFDLRMVSFGPRDIANVLEALRREGSTAPLGIIWERLSHNRHLARAMTCAMLVRREIGFSLTDDVTADTPAHRPEPAVVPGRLRSFLAEHAAE